MKISYHAETDSLYIHLNNLPSDDVMIVNNDMNIDLDASGHSPGIEIHQSASKYIDLENMEIKSFPIHNIAIAA